VRPAADYDFFTVRGCTPNARLVRPNTDTGRHKRGSDAGRDAADVSSRDLGSCVGCRPRRNGSRSARFESRNVETQRREIQIRPRTAADERDDCQRSVGNQRSQIHDYHRGGSAHYDGKDYKVTFTVGTPDVDTAALRRVDASTVTYTNKKDGKVVETGTAVVSSNGKVMTITWTATNAEGQKENGVEIYDKQ
jgi:hypothetical protein